MNDKIIDFPGKMAANRGSRDDPATIRKNEKFARRREHGQQVLDRLDGEKNLRPDTRVKLARQLDRALSRASQEEFRNIDAEFGKLIAHRRGDGCDLNPAKERYRLTLKAGQNSERSRLRASGRGYRDLIVAVANACKSDPRLIADEVGFGTDLHPTDPLMASEAERLCKQLEDIADAVNRRFKLTDRLRELAQYKVRLLQEGECGNWPFRDFLNRDLLNVEGIEDDRDDWKRESSAYWGPGGPEDEPGYLIVGGASWLDPIAYFPHSPLGFNANFDDQMGLEWPLSDREDALVKMHGGRLRPYGDPREPDELYQARYGRRLELFRCIDDDLPTIEVKGGAGSTNVIMLGGLGEETELVNRFQKFHGEWVIKAGLDVNDYFDKNVPEVFWLMLYPNPVLERLMPMLVTLDYWVMMLDPITPSMFIEGQRSPRVMRCLRDAHGEPQEIVTESVGARLKRALHIPSETEGCEVHRNFFRTARALNHLPLLKRLDREREQQTLHARLLESIENGTWPPSNENS